ncbi:MAG: Gfo/Idh/MocA family protein [Acetobacteraceae bacterium]
MGESLSEHRVRVGILGAGSRGIGAYGSYMRRRPDLAQVVAIADPRPDRLREAGAQHGVDPNHLYDDWQPLLLNEPDLDAIIIATPDRLHMHAAMAAIAHGASILLEKPIAPTEDEVNRLLAAAHKARADITVAHVLRYTPFFTRIKELLDRGVIGQLLTVRHTEHIGYWHFAHSYVRGNWRRMEDSSPMILAKACHDFDILRWLIDHRCAELNSFGQLSHFIAENRPEGATDRCDQGCKIERECPYSAQRVYLEKFPPANGWPHDVLSLDTTPDGIARALHDGPYGRCVYACDNDVVDHQVVSMRFGNGVDATMNVSAFTREMTRTIHLMGTYGEIAGDFFANEITLSDFRLNDVRTSQFTLSSEGYHGGGDDALMGDFIGRVRQRMRDGDVTDSLTSLEHSVASHRMAFAAERSRLAGENVVLMPRNGLG